MPTIGPIEIIVVLVVVILLFGVGRIGKIGGELGKSIREFRKGLEGDEKKAADKPVDSASSAGSETKVS